MIFGLLQAWEQLSGNLLALAGSKAKGNHEVDHSYITPTIIGMSRQNMKFFESVIENDVHMKNRQSHQINNLIMWFYSYRLALGDFNESNLEELKRLMQGDPVVFWNLG